jgi:hypothetical protein
MLHVFTNLYRDTNVTRIFYKLSQTCGMHANRDSYLGTERVDHNYKC